MSKQVLIKSLYDEKYCITGSYAFNIKGYTPKDTDICILCKDNNEHYSTICSKLEKFARRKRAAVKYREEYSVPFSWGGVTFCRVNILQYDFFFVDEKTFLAIEQTTDYIKNMENTFKANLLINKKFRISLFQLIAESIYDRP